MAKQKVRVLITGAAGQIGYALLFRIAAGEMFGQDTAVELHLLELEAALPALQGVMMELEDCAFPLLKKVVCTSNMKDAADGINWALLVGAVPRKAGMERGDLLSINGGIFTKQGQAINNYAASDVKVLVVGNPCNTNCLIAMHHAPDVAPENFYAMTMLDEKRARAQLAIKAGVDVSAVSQMIIWGNHSATQYPDFYNAKIADRPALEMIKDETWLQNDFIPLVQTRGAAVIKARGSSSAASASNAIISSVRSLREDTPAAESYSMCRISRGEYDVDEGLIYSFPCSTTAGKSTIISNLPHNEFAKKKLQITLEELRAERDAVTELGLI